MKKVLVLGAGKHQRIEGAEHHDILNFEGIDYRFDLNKSWVINQCGDSFKRDTFDHIIATHVIEHLKDLRYFMDSCWHLLKSDGILEIETPNAGMNPDLEFCDPTHIRCYRPHTFHNYFTPEGIEKFGYTDKAWKMEVTTFQLEVPDDCIRVIATPIK